jgi:hypothetical protein
VIIGADCLSDDEPSSRSAGQRIETKEGTRYRKERLLGCARCGKEQVRREVATRQLSCLECFVSRYFLFRRASVTRFPFAPPCV